MIFESKFGLLAIGYDASIAQIFLVMATIALASMVPIPANLGILEASEAYLLIILKINPYMGIAFALLVRLKDVRWTGIGLVLLSHTGVNIFALLLKNNKDKNGSELSS